MSRFKLKPKLVENTISQLRERIEDRFPGSGLGKVCSELLAIARIAERRSIWLARPVIWLRLFAFVLIGLILCISVSQLFFVDWTANRIVWTEFAQGIEALVNEVILIAAAIFFVATLESRLKRRRGLKAIHELRSIAHVIDMHQLTKDPERSLSKVYQATKSSPQMKLDRFELRRYLDYCSEMLSLTGKVAAEYVSNFDDAVMVSAVNEVETLTADLSRKIWQKIMILHSFDNNDVQRSSTPVAAGQPAATVPTGTGKM